MEHTALELLTADGDTLLLNFRTKGTRSRVRRWIKKKCTLAYRDRDRQRAAFRAMLAELQESWQARELSTF